MPSVFQSSSSQSIASHRNRCVDVDLPFFLTLRFKRLQTVVQFLLFKILQDQKGHLQSLHHGGLGIVAGKIFQSEENFQLEVKRSKPAPTATKNPTTSASSGIDTTEVSSEK